MPNEIIDRIKNTFKLGETYSREIIEQTLKYKPKGSERKGVLGGPNVGYLCLMVTLQKFEYNEDFTDHIAGSMLFWSGQKTSRSAETAIKRNKGRFFVFVRARLSDGFVFYGEAKPVRFLEKGEHVSSEFVFNLSEYASSDFFSFGPRKTISYNPADFRNDSLRIWHYTCSTSEVNDPSLLITRHIQPIDEATNIEALDPKNSLVLTPELDNLFYRGIVSFSPSTGKILLPNNYNLVKNLELMHIDSSCQLRYVPEGTDKYLYYHNIYLYRYLNCDARWQFQ